MSREHMRRMASALVVACGVSAIVAAQRSNLPSFEVASVKANPLRTGIRGHSFPADRFVAVNVPLKDLVIVAYGAPGQPLPEVQLVGGPQWIGSDRFDINARVPAAGPNTVAGKQRMLRTLLVERFKLAVHTETRTVPVYALVLARKDNALGRQLRHASVDCEALLASQPGRRDQCLLYALPSGKLMVRGQTMAALANAFTRLLGRVVVDRTGLDGGFDADADFNPEGLPGVTLPPGSQDRASDAPSLFAAIDEELGLKLESTRAPVEVLIIDSAEHPTID